MSTRTKFQDSWLEKVDCNDNIVSQWAEKDFNNVYNCICNICNCSIVTEKGFDKLNQHAKTNKHKQNLFKVKANQLHFTTAVTSLTAKAALAPNQSTVLQKSVEQTEFNKNESAISHMVLKKSTPVSLFSSADIATRAELFYCMDIVKLNSPVAFCDGKKELFQVMFPGCVPNNFSLSSSKASYYINYALGPYFKDKLLSELQAPNVYFTLQFDETGNAKGRKELQIRVQYWSSSENAIVNRHLVTYFIEKGDAVTLFKYLIQSLDSHNLSIKKVLTLSRDGPNVNKKVFRLFQEELKENNYKCLLDIGTCLLHAAHNAFLKGMQCLDLEISDFLIKIFYYFHDQHLRCENFKIIQSQLKLPQHSFIKHATTRWLTIGPAADRIVEQLSAINEYFLKYIPTKENNTTKKQTYIDICQYLKNKSLRPALEFTIYTSKIFTNEFTCIMQRDEPLIHILYAQFKKLIYLLCSNVVKENILTEKFINLKSSTKDLLEDSSNIRNLNEISFGENVKSSILVLPQLDRMAFLNSVKKFYLKAAIYLFDKITNLRILKNFKCLLPEHIKNSNSVKNIVEIANALPLYNIDVDQLLNEWKLLQIDSDISFELDTNQRIDNYWGRIFSLKNSSDIRYPMISIIVKSALSLTHGSANVERGFSASSKILTDERSNMDEKTLNARLNVKDGLKRFNSAVCTVPITNELLKLARTARSSYHAHLDEQKKLLEEKQKNEEAELKRKNNEKILLENVQKRIQTVADHELELKKQEKIYQEYINESESMELVLKNATKSTSSKVVLQEMVFSLENIRKREKDQRVKVDKLREKVLKRKSQILETAVTKRLKLTERDN